MTSRDDEVIRERADASCGARFEIPAECRLPPGHAGEHAPDTIARALLTIGIVSDELEADRREFNRERVEIRDAYQRAMDRLRVATIVVAGIGCVALGCVAAALVQLSS